MSDVTAPKAKPTVRMTEEEAWTMLERAVNGTLTTLRRDGRPVALPVWFVVLDRHIYVSTRGKKVERARRDARASFLVEAGERWAELRAVHLDCQARVLDDPDPELARRVAEAMDAKYAALRTTTKAMPTATREHYKKAAGAIIELVPDSKVLSWDNRKLGLA